MPRRKPVSRLDEALDDARQLELDFTAAIVEAMDDPETADVIGMFEGIAGALTQLSDQEQLRMAGTIILQLSDVCEHRANHLWQEWEEQHQETGLTLNDDVLAGLMRRTTQIDLSDLITKPQRQRREKPHKPQANDSTVGVVDKATLLEVLDQIGDETTAKQRALDVAHDENVSRWIEAITDWLREHSSGQPVPLLTLSDGLEMPLVKVWLGLLLGGFQLEQQGDLYESDICIRLCPGRTSTDGSSNIA